MKSNLRPSTETICRQTIIRVSSRAIIHAKPDRWPEILLPSYPENHRFFFELN